MSEAAGGPTVGRGWSRTGFYGRSVTWDLDTGFGKTLRAWF